MNSKNKSNDKLFFILAIVLFFVFAILAYCTPYTNDDWAWGDKIGAERLSTFFAGYNGRYLGNLLILLIANSRIAMILCMAASFTVACLIPCYYSKNNSFTALLMSGVLFFLLPKAIYAQIVGWASGYSNYMPPILLLTLYFIIIKNIFDEGEIKYSKFTPLLTFVIAFAGALFMENITLTNIAVAFLVIIFVLFKEKKFHLTHITFAIGALGGAAVMFSNAAYGIIAKSGDDYRNVPTGMKEIIKTVVEHLNDAVNYIFINNLIICFIASTLLIAICYLYTKDKSDSKSRAISGIIAFANCFALLIFFVKNRYPDWMIISKKYTTLFIWGAAALYCLSLFFGFIFCVKDKSKKFKLLLLLVTVALIVAPLMIVNPITARCYYPPYFVICMMIIEMFSYIIGEAEQSEAVNRTLNAGLIGSLLALCVFYLSIFSFIHSYDNMRSEYIKKQNENNEKVVKVTTLPYDDYIWASSPHNDLWIGRFKVYYDIDEEAEMKYVDYKDYKKFAKKYDKKHQ